MVNSEPQLQFDKEKGIYSCVGHWSVSTVNDLSEQFEKLSVPKQEHLVLDGQKLSYFDSAGAILLQNWVEDFKKKGKTVSFEHFNEQHQSLLSLIESKEKTIFQHPPVVKAKPILYRIGVETIEKFKQVDGFIVLLGDLFTRLFGALGQWRRFQLPSIVSIIDSAGIQALPIIGLLSFLIGVVLAYQMGLQLQTYGANIFIAYLSGMAIFREFAPLITAIIVAGRTSSSFTAQIGSMKVNEEIDALYTMGLSPTELLVMPKVLGLLIFFPLLIFWSDIFGILGSMYMSKWMLGVSYYDYMARLKESVGVTQLLLGLYKAPAFALLIALVGCYQGFLVKPSADSVGSQTTRSVVQALFMIIVADAIFSIMYSWLGV